MPSDISLTTISEEPTQYSSHEIIVEPKVVVETSTIPMDGGGGGGSGAAVDTQSSSRNVSFIHVTVFSSKFSSPACYSDKICHIS